MNRFAMLATALLGIAFGGASASASDLIRPWDKAEVTVDTGLLWKVGGSTPLSYRIVPTQISWLSPRGFGREFAGGAQLMVRRRFGLIATWIQQGPESHYIGVNISPSIELWNRAGTWALVGGAGGGIGVIDSRGVAGGQGQDFTLHSFGRIAVEHVSKSGLRYSGGLLLHHMSNGGQTNPNPGMNAFGFTLGLSRPL